MFRFQGNLFLLKRLVLCSTDNIDIDMQEMQVGNTTLLRQEGKMVYRAEGKEKLLGKKRRFPKLEALETCDFKGILFHLLPIID